MEVNSGQSKHSISDWLNKLQLARSNSDRKELFLYQSTDVGRNLVILCSNPKVRFFMKLENFDPTKIEDSQHLEEMAYYEELYNFLLRISKGEDRGKKAASDFYKLLGKAPDESALQWSVQLLRKSVRIGMSYTTISSLYGSKHKVGLMLAKTTSIEELTKLQYPIVVEPKIDGYRCYVTLPPIGESCDAKLFTRTHTPITNQPYLIEELNKLRQVDSIILDGELFGGSWEETSSSVSSKEVNEKPKLSFIVFDWISQKPFSERREFLRRTLSNLGKESRVNWIQSEVANSVDDVIAAYEKVVREKIYEGLMVKALDKGYISGRSTNWLKLKPFETYDGTVTGFVKGTEGKAYEGQYIGFTVDLEDGTTCSVTNGINEAIRASINENTEDFWIGRTIEVSGQAKNENNSAKTGAKKRIRHPTFLRVRHDKNP